MEQDKLGKTLLNPVKGSRIVAVGRVTVLRLSPSNIKDHYHL